MDVPAIIGLISVCISLALVLFVRLNEWPETRRGWQRFKIAWREYRAAVAEHRRLSRRKPRHDPSDQHICGDCPHVPDDFKIRSHNVGRTTL